MDILDADLFSFISAKQHNKSQEKLVKDDRNNEDLTHGHGDMEESNGVGNASITFNRISNFNLASIALTCVSLLPLNGEQLALLFIWFSLLLKSCGWLIKNLFHLCNLSNSFYFNQSNAI
jgi:hypothetical protein